MAQDQVTKTIVLNGKVGAEYKNMVAQVLQFGEALEQLGSKAGQFLGESLDVYKDYESNMLAARFALSTQYKDASQLNKVMEQLGESAAKWAETSIFHTSDVSEAINEAAHAGWDLEEILQGIPQAMLISQAGGMELSEGLDYLVKMINSTGSGFEDAGTIVDQWAMAANSSATNIQELGDAFMALGASAQFGDSTSELFTMLAVLANVGTVGSQAGTALRNSIVRIIAPTEKANAAMELLGLETEEIQEALADQSVQKAAKKLDALGFSAYKTDGELKPLLDIYSELYEVTKGLDEESRNEILAAIFPTRTISTAIALLEAANGAAVELKKNIDNSQGYAKKGSEIMMSGLEGSQKLLESKWEEFKRQVGEFTAPDLEKFNTALSGILDSMNNWPDETWKAFVTGMETLAVGGAIAGGVKTVASIYGMLGPWGSLALLTTVATASLIGYFNELDQKNWAEKFGSMELDVDALNTYMAGVHTKWDEEKQLLATYVESITKSMTTYEEASTKLNQQLFTSAITGKELTPAEKDNINKYYESLIGAVTDGIENAKSLETYRTQFKLEAAGEVAGESESGSVMMYLLESYFTGLEQEADEAGKNLGAIISTALADGIVSVDEQQAIDEGVKKMNEIEQQIADTVRAKNFQASLYKAQHLGWDSVSSFIASTAEERDKNIQDIENDYFDELAFWQVTLDRALENGTEIVYEGKKQKVDASNYDELWDLIKGTLDTSLEEEKKSEHEKYDNLMMNAFDTLIGGSEEFGAGWQFYRENLYGKNLDTIDWEDMIRNGGLTQDIADQIEKIFSNKRLMDLMKLTGMGAEDFMSEFAGGAYTIGYLLANYKDYLESGGTDDIANMFSTEAQREARLAAEAQGKETERFQNELNDLIAQRQKLSQEIELYNLGLAAGDTDSMGNPMYNEETLNELMTKRAELDQQIEALQEKINGVDTELEFEPDFKEVIETPPPDLKGTVYYSPKFLGGEVPRFLRTFAEGGRATTASIFGEAGPEWAIPEEHSERTADLLAATARASGFTWNELLARNGGLNGNANSGPNVTIGNYAPVINAGDATGVAQALAEDKERLKQIIKDAIREGEMQRDMRKYA